MALPNGGGGYQVGTGNLDEPLIDAIPLPVSVTATATLTAAQVLNLHAIRSPRTSSTRQTYAPGRRCEEFNTAIIMITHDLGVVAEIADDVVVMYAGRVAEEGTVDEIFTRPHHHLSGLLLGGCWNARLRGGSPAGSDQHL